MNVGIRIISLTSLNSHRTSERELIGGVVRAPVR